MAVMIEILIGTIMARILVAFIRNRTKDTTNISWVFKKIKMSGLKFDWMCKGIALGLVLVFYLLHSMGISKILPHIHILFIYIEEVVLFMAPLKAEAECCLMIKVVPWEAFGWVGVRENARYVERQKEVPLMSSGVEIGIIIMIYLKIINFIGYDTFMDVRYIIGFEILLIIDRIREDKRFKKIEAQYYEEKFSEYYEK